MSADSRPVSSNQSGTHPQLARIVERHLQSSHARPAAPHSEAAFQLLQQELDGSGRGLVLDSFCGSGHSTAILAQRHPQHLVIGIDKSAHRLDRHPPGSANNYLLLQAHCEDIWQLLLRHDYQLDYHYLLYPNPWPKSRHLQRRVHGHGSFPWLLQLGGQLELRSNWQLYVEEFGLAANLAGHPGVVGRVSGDPALTLFEKKYRLSGHLLWAFRTRLRAPAEQ